MSLSGAPQAAPPPGWYPDPWAPTGSPIGRWWDGQQWTPQTAGGPAADSATQGPGSAQAALSPHGVPMAAPGKRLLARVVDGLILGVVLMVPLLLVGWAVLSSTVHKLVDLGNQNLTPEESDRQANAIIHDALPAFLVFYLAIFLFSFALQMLYEALLIHHSGQTIGKKIAGVRVVRLEDGRPPSLGAAFGRTAIGIVLNGVYIDQLWCLWDKPWRQCIHDKPVKTIVVKA